jgi:hypothetical protein
VIFLGPFHGPAQPYIGSMLNMLIQPYPNDNVHVLFISINCFKLVTSLQTLRTAGTMWAKRHTTKDFLTLQARRHRESEILRLAPEWRKIMLWGEGNWRHLRRTGKSHKKLLPCCGVCTQYINIYVHTIYNNQTQAKNSIISPALKL